MRGMAVPAGAAEAARRPPAPAPHAAAPPATEREEGDANALEPAIYRFVLRYSLPQQLLLLALTLASFPFLYVSLDLPKTIINRAIHGSRFPQKLLGFEFGQVGYLFALCAAYLALVFINGGFKYFINTYKGRLGERMLRRLRYQLYHRMLRFPLSRFRKTSSAQIIPMITAEGEGIGGFIGDAFALPAFQGGTLLTIVLFMFMQDAVLGAAAVVLYPFPLYAIPRLQRKVNQLGRLRVREIRRVADRIQEAATGIVDIRANDMVKLQLAGFARLLGHIYEIRFEIYKRKYFIKFLNNFIAQLTPFFLYALGGYLVIQGQLSFGGLVAVLAAYKDLSPPWRELLNFYQSKEDARIKYEQIVEQFEIADMLDARLHLAEPDAAAAGRRARWLDEARKSGNITLDIDADWVDYEAAGVGDRDQLLLFSDLPPEHEFFERYSFIGAGDLPGFAEILARIGRGGSARLARADRARLLSLPFKLIPARHRLDALDAGMQARLSPAQRQKAAIARAVLKRPDLLILNEATSALDGQSQALVAQGLRADFAGRGLVWVLHRPSLARSFERVLVMSNGRLEEQGRFAELDTKDSLMSLLIAAE
jgi:ABC-type multidrug transport system fused ATPase/permease subunit